VTNAECRMSICECILGKRESRMLGHLLPTKLKVESKFESNSLSRLWGEGDRSDSGRERRVRGLRPAETLPSASEVARCT